MISVTRISQLAQKHRSVIARCGIATAVLLIAWLMASVISPYQAPKSAIDAPFAVVTDQKQTIIRARVMEKTPQQLRVQIQDGPRAYQEISLNHSYVTEGVQLGDTVLVAAQKDGDLSPWAHQAWRLPGVILLLGAFIAVVLLVIGRRGIYSVVGLFLSVAVIALYIVPAILQGQNAFWACLAGSYVIGIISVFVAHGMQRRALLSVISITVVLSVVAVLALIGDRIGMLTGLYDETSSLLATSHKGIDMHGVLIGGIIIATLGVLDDVVTTQVAAVDELRRANPAYSWRELFRRASSVGGEHIIALVNTLALAYIGVSMPTILAIASAPNVYGSPLLLPNSEFYAQEIIRTLVSSIGLILAVPITTLCASLYYAQRLRYTRKSKK
jgi:uncharacterized membrane protein